MAFSHTIGSLRYTFASLADLLAKATPLRSGDVLAEVAAESAEQRVAAQFALADLPPHVDPCGERGEFHSFCRDSPDFRFEIPVATGEIVHRDGFWFADLLPDA